MSRIRLLPKKELERYLRSGEFDEWHQAWPGPHFIERAQLGGTALREALIATVRQRTAHAVVPKALAALNVTAFARQQLMPLVRGLFPRGEQDVVLTVLARSIVFLTPDTIHTVLAETRWLGTAWTLANLYLGSVDADLLSDEAPSIVGLSEETTCYVSMEYFHEQNRFDDFVMHEAAHIFHNCKRQTIGLPEIRGREWLRGVRPHHRVRPYFGGTQSVAFAARAGTATGPQRSRRRRVSRHTARGCRCAKWVEAYSGAVLGAQTVGRYQFP